ncbi:hypothetical protein BGZ80_003385 [Entomortierella chlamydospora]|uniref:Uncharacterized protein n=1 Tax=Entomortierella chlamydospora TaxID=101097 RepID=A0A9P6MPB1_9FUNG|nr:hypothetical protein BGZ80_003385 [Entomortierella chlamydospora]
MSEQKQEYITEKEHVEEKFDVERTSVILDEENSPIPEVAAIVPNTDDPSLPSLTFRFWIMATGFSVLISFCNQFFWFRQDPISIGMSVVQLLAYPLGKFMARVLPTGILNPGPFNIKEHVCIALAANCASGTAYAMDIIVIQRVFYGQNFGFLANFLLILTTQLLGFGLAGVLRRYLVYPAAMVWPANLVQVALFSTLHKDEDLARGQWSRYKFFMIAFATVFLYEWIPTFIFPVIGALAWVCWIKPESIVVTQIGGPSGLGFGVITLDWNVITAWLGSPLVVPWWAQVNIGIGFFLIAWILVPITYYTDVWEAKKFPIVTPGLFRDNGDSYDATAVLTSGVLNETLYEAYGPLRISTFFALTYGIGFAGLTSMLSHTWLYHRHKLVAQWKQSREHSEDIHHKLMQAYPEVPDWWYIAIFVSMIIVAIVTCEVWDYKLPWWGVILAVVICCIFVLPVGLITALTNQMPGLNIITEYVIGYALPGHPIANITFKTLGYISMTQALTFVGDLKLGHYMKVPPRSMFWAQILGTLIAALVNLLTADWLLSSQQGVCTTSVDFPCPYAGTFYSASVIWGVISPQRMFGSGSMYNVVNYFFIIGLILPIPFYYLKKWVKSSWVEFIHLPVLLTATGMMPPAQAMNYTNWLVMGFIFQFFARRYHAEWHLRFTYVLSSALDSGTAFCVLISFFIFTNRNVSMPNWWGTRTDLCPLDGNSYTPPAAIPTSS